MTRTIRLHLCMITMILICIGVVMIYSSTSIYAADRFHDSFYFLKRHLSFLAIGCVVTFLSMCFDYRKLARFAKPLMVVSFVLLILVLIPHIGRQVSGARRWFSLGFFNFQPSELANLAVIIYVADFISRKTDQIKSFWKGFMPPMLVLGMTDLLILVQPDLGTSVALGAVVLIMLFVGRVRITYLVSMVLLSIPALLVLIITAPYRVARIMAFVNPWADPKHVGFQVIQSQIALGSGGIFGVGLGHSKQKLFYLPAAHTDFIFSIIGEELGLIGTLGVIALFIIFIQQALKVVKNAPDKFGFFLSLGVVSMICFKAVINIGVSCGILPTKGLPLPFISYGGSSFIFVMLGVGLLLNIARTGEYP